MDFYLRDTADVGLLSDEVGSDIIFRGCCDLDYTRDIDNRKSFSSYVYILGVSPIS